MYYNVLFLYCQYNILYVFSPRFPLVYNYAPALFIDIAGWDV